MRSLDGWMTLVGVVGAFAGRGTAQCPQAATGFELPGLNGVVRSLHGCDLGDGRKLYAAGDFTTIEGAAVKHVARWDGSDWTALGSGLSSTANALLDWDDGSGRALYATGGFVNAGGTQVMGLAKWDGSSWSGLGGLDSYGRALAVHDSGAGEELYVAGNFSFVDGVFTGAVARFDGVMWQPAGDPAFWERVDTLAVFDDGSGAKLYAGGKTSTIQFVVARLDGAQWTTVGTFQLGQQTFALPFRSMVVFDDGGGPALFVGGEITYLGGYTSGITRFDGSNWTSVGSAFDWYVNALEVFDDGSGPALFAGSSNGLPRKLVGGQWQALGADGGQGVFALETFDDGGGERLWVGGEIPSIGTVFASHIATWDGSSWGNTQAPDHGRGVGGSSGGETLAFERHDDGSGPATYVAGDLQTFGAQATRGVARWNGSVWSIVGGGIDGTVRRLESCALGAGPPLLFAGGSFATAGSSAIDALAAWDGTQWSAVGGGLAPNHHVHALLSSDVGGAPALYVGGTFHTVGGVVVKNVARWDGATWSALGAGFDGVVRDLAVFDDGNGPRLYAAGSFTQSGANLQRGVAVFDGQQWSMAGGGVWGLPWDLEVHDDGSGPALYVAGQNVTSQFTSATPNIARFENGVWTDPLPALTGDSYNATVRTLSSFDDGLGRALYAGGYIAFAGGVPVRGIAKWRAGQWSNVLGGLESNLSLCSSLQVIDDGSSPRGALYVGGRFKQFGGVVSNDIGVLFDPCACAATSYCTSGTTSSGCTPTMSAVGHASASAGTLFELRATQLEGGKSGHVFYGIHGPHAAPWGQSSHFLCVKAPTQRTGTQSTGGSAGQCNGVIVLGWNEYAATHPDALGQPFSTGQEVWAQCYFRDPAGPKTTALTNGLHFTLCP